jgi:uncharacterized membrane-anchored protein YitT (DUF2179 family)
MWQRLWHGVRDYAIITVGVVMSAIAARAFLVPNQVVGGGITGISIMANTLFDVPVGLFILALNVPLFVLGWRTLGGLKFALRTIYATTLLAVSIDLLADYLPTITHDPLLYSLYGGLLDGVGVGLVLRAGGTTGGTDIIARILERRIGVAPGRSILFMDVAVLVGAFVLYGPDKTLYALLVAFVVTRTIDATLAAGKGSRQLFIITSQAEVIIREVFSRLGRGVTVIDGKGGYTRRPRTILVVAVARNELGIIKALVTDSDPQAFVIVGEALEILGEGFTHPSVLPNSPVPLASASETLPLAEEDWPPAG